MPGALVVREGPLAGQRFEVQGEVLVGRENAAVTIDDPKVSRSHARVRPVAGGLEIVDAGSRHGTWVNGKQIEAATLLVSGDEVLVGETTLAVELPRTATVVSPAAPAAPAPTPASPPPAAVAVPAVAPAESFGAHAAPVGRGGSRKVASRTLTPTLLSFGCVAAVAVALVVYFAQH